MSLHAMVVEVSFEAHPLSYYGIPEPEPILPDNMDPCGKYWYATREEAENNLKLLGWTSNKGPRFKMNAYYCFGCDGFHIGHTEMKREVVEA